MPNESKSIQGKVLQCVNDNLPLYLVIGEDKQAYAACISCKEARFKFGLVYDPERRTLDSREYLIVSGGGPSVAGRQAVGTIASVPARGNERMDLEIKQYIRDFFEGKMQPEIEKARIFNVIPALIIKNEELERFINDLWFYLQDKTHQS